MYLHLEFNALKFICNTYTSKDSMLLKAFLWKAPRMKIWEVQAWVYWTWACSKIWAAA